MELLPKPWNERLFYTVQDRITTTCLVSKTFCIVITNPLVILDQIWHFVFIVPITCSAILQNFTNLKIECEWKHIKTCNKIIKKIVRAAKYHSRLKLSSNVLRNYYVAKVPLRQFYFHFVIFIFLQLSVSAILEVHQR